MTATARLDSGNRSFLLLFGVVVGFRFTLMLLACCVVCVVGFQLVTAGPAVLLTGNGWLLPAALLACLIIATTVAVIVRAARELNADRTLRSRVRSRSVPVDPQIRETAARHGLAGRVAVVEDPAVFGFTYGFLAPRVILSSALARTMTPAELAAVLAHESVHVRGRDPLKVLLARLMVSREFYLPVLRHLAARFVGGRELAADRHAIAAAGVRPLAQADRKSVV